MNRRYFILGLLGFTALVSIRKVGAMGLFDQKKSSKEFAFMLNDAEWKEKLEPEAYHVMREAGTERSGTSPLNNEKRKGVFHCKGCDWELFSSEHKFDSGTGWPSYWQPISDKAIGISVDRKLIYARTEEHCANCGSHLGHIFDDGPKPTGKRHCINGIAMVFKPAEA